MQAYTDYNMNMNQAQQSEQPSSPNPNHGATEWFEIERKYEVLGDDVLPDDYTSAGLTADDSETFELVASYQDTPLRALADQRLALRHRIGGPDAGWHLKERGADGSKEMTWPSSATLPDGALEILQQRFGDSARELSPTATLRTTRTLVRLRDSEGRNVIDIVDDRVYAFDHVEEVERTWREWEAELQPNADPKLLDLVQPVLESAGAVDSLSDSKIARALGKILELAEGHGATPRQLASLAITDVADRMGAQTQSDEGDIELLRRLARSVLG